MVWDESLEFHPDGEDEGNYWEDKWRKIKKCECESDNLFNFNFSSNKKHFC